MFIVDTNILSGLRRKARVEPRIAAWMESIEPTDLFVSAITILEIEIGARLMARRDAQQGATLRNWIDNEVLSTFERRILPVDTAVVQKCAALHVPDKRPERDALIAATALVHSMRVVTRNVKDFEPMGVGIVNPFEA